MSIPSLLMCPATDDLSIRERDKDKESDGDNVMKVSNPAFGRQSSLASKSFGI